MSQHSTHVQKMKEMKKKTWRNSLAIAGSLLAILIFSGRRKPVNTEIHSKSFSERLEDDLAVAEAMYDDIIPGAEKTIVWADSSRQKTEYAIVYLHGFSATRQETAPLSDDLASRWGANLFYTRLSGHGRSGEAMAEPTVNDWLNDAHEALEIGKRIGEKVIVIGTSTGGTLATWLATQPASKDIAGVVLISPNFWVQATGAGAMLWPWGPQILNMVQGDTYEWEPFNEGHAQFWTNKYPSVALVEMMKLLDHVNDQNFDVIEVPSLFIYSPNDQVVVPAEIEAAYERFGSSIKQIEAIQEVEDRNNHVLAGEILSPSSTEQLTDLIDTFMQQL